MSDYKGALRIMALNVQGEEAIRQAWREDARAGWSQKTLANRIFIKEIVSTKPMVIRILIKNNHYTRMTSISDIKYSVMKTLKENGAYPEDFDISEVEV